jgi:hypothetical protein
MQRSKDVAAMVLWAYRVFETCTDGGRVNAATIGVPSDGWIRRVRLSSDEGACIGSDLPGSETQHLHANPQPHEDSGIA